MKKIILSIAIITISFTTIAQVGVGTSTPDASAALDVESTTKGLLPPRMTEAQMSAIASPAEGLMVYCTDCNPKGIYYNDGSYFVNSVTGTPENLSPTDVYSPTGKIWMDRNLGATQVATSSTDAASYGDLYQWGRTSDGHESRISTAVTGPVVSGTEGSDFIISSSDWLSTADDTRWNGASKGIHDPCPSGYRIPTEAELNSERLVWTSNNAAGAFNALKLPLGGNRSSTSPAANVGTNAFYWTSTAVSGGNARYMWFHSSNAGINSNRRALGCSVRCIKE